MDGAPGLTSSDRTLVPSSFLLLLVSHLLLEAMHLLLEAFCGAETTCFARLEDESRTATVQARTSGSPAVALLSRSKSEGKSLWWGAAIREAMKSTWRELWPVWPQAHCIEQLVVFSAFL